MRKATIESLKLLQMIGNEHQREEATKELERRLLVIKEWSGK
jgi:hypothetical protein